MTNTFFKDSYLRTSWSNHLNLLHKLQKRLYKASLVANRKVCFILQKAILGSNSARLISIRYVTQISINRKISGIDGKLSLTFSERFELNEFLRLNVYNWQTKPLRKSSRICKEGLITVVNVSTISDRSWQCLINFALEPFHEALFYPNSLGFRSGRSIYEVQKRVFFNLKSDSYGLQKRVLKVNFSDIFSKVNIKTVILRLFAPRGIKLGIFRLFDSGFMLCFDEHSMIEGEGLCNLLSNLFFSDFDLVHNGLRFGSEVIYFLKPLENELVLIDKLNNLIIQLGIKSYNIKTLFFTISGGFDFLGWHFKFLKNSFIVTPSFTNYQTFLSRIKRIINNSNFGSVVKANKIAPLVKEWRSYHKYSSLVGPRFSLYYIKKKAFKSFNKETRQDFYSSQILLDRCFNKLESFENNSIEGRVFNSPYYGHMIFWISLKNFLKVFLCIHCGMLI